MKIQINGTEYEVEGTVNVLCVAVTYKKGDKTETVLIPESEYKPLE